MKGLMHLALAPRCAGCGARHGLAWLLGVGRSVVLTLWMVSVLAFFALVAASAML